MLVSTRAAARVLAEVGLTRNQAACVLGAGLAGPALRTSAAVLHDENGARELAGRPEITGDAVQAVAGVGLMTLRKRTGLDVHADWDQLAHAVADGWKMNYLTRLRFHIRLTEGPPIACVATVSGFVVFGADLVGVTGLASGRVSLEFARPGDWFRWFVGRRMPGGPGSAWRYWEADPSCAGAIPGPALQQ